MSRFTVGRTYLAYNPLSKRPERIRIENRTANTVDISFLARPSSTQRIVVREGVSCEWLKLHDGLDTSCDSACLV